ncbi:MAG: two-component system cell cycle sensor histidine kinase/response regulator CckA [Myxococcota bacterium]|jgi:two-component system cell cycle sensor histidine kinase/response regulator CckA
MEMLEWRIDRAQIIQEGQWAGWSIASCFPDQPEDSALWTTLLSALSGQSASSSFVHDDIPWRVAAHPCDGGAVGICAPRASGPSAPDVILSEYNIQGRAIRPLAHNINNQLGAICNYTALISHQVSESVAAELDAIEQLAFRAADHLNALRLLSSPLEESPRQMSISRWLTAQLAGQRSHHPEREITQAIINDAHISASPSALGIALREAIRNAAEATEARGRIHITVDISLLSASDLAGWPSAPGQYVHIRIEDSGEGMDEEALETSLHLFQSQRHPSRGVGLATIFSIARQHSGRVFIESAPGTGTALTMSLPLETATAQRRAELIVTPASRSGQVSPTSTKTLLVADDTPAILRATSRLLVRAGYTVVSVGDGTQALATFQAEPDRFSAVLIDDKMPGPSGITLARMLTELRSDLPVLLVTGHPQQQSCPFPVLDKPYRPSQLLDLLETILS